MFKNIFFFFLIVAPFIAAYKPSCKCPENEQPGQLSCNGCEPSCDNRKPEVCTKMACECSCDCVPELLRDKKTKKCVPKEKCPY
ncbi:hypothetical protein niasHS_013024 [Heterodera schachtii]|uniref:TIL domain-containing protein n=1 Tax=Heterodera schachtii TaxID=97005 RepID=A0ABD2IR43_HETSC